jgi:DNA segregation ATPase FtsK/SpoIIIE, S-DNA-T family
VGVTLGTALYHVCRGWESWARRGWDAATLGIHRRQINAAEALGDQVLLAEWIERKHHAQERRHQHLLNLPRLAASIARVTVGVMAGLVALTLLAGLVAQLCGVGSFLGVLTGVRSTIRGIATVVAWAWTPAWIALPIVAVVAAWREGHRGATTAPGWVGTTGDADVDLTIDETTVAAALMALRIPQITEYVKKGLKIQYVTLIHASGRGVHMIIRLPAGVPAERISRRRPDLATGLHRLAKEVWPTTGAEEGLLDLWIANKGALAQGAGPYPLLTEGVTDVFKGVPFGKTLRGDPIMAPLMERNTIVGGMPGQGKSSAAMILMIGAALDPTAELRIWVPDSNYDFEAFKPRCSRYVMGAEPEKIAEILQDLRDLHAEVQARGDLLVKYETPAVTRELANRNIGLHPLKCLLEEAHVAIQDPTHGPEIAQLLINIVRLGRKRGIHLIVSTQAPTKDSMPRDVTRNCSNGIAFAVGDHVANDALLGQGAYAAGHRATELIPGTDRGTALVKGFTGQRSELIQAYFLSVAKGHDQITPIINRSLTAIAERGEPLPGARSTTRTIEAPRDLLDDLDEVLDTTPIPAADIPPLLARLAPGWAPYQRMTGKSLRAALDELGVKVPSTGNKHPVDPLTVRSVLAQRATADLDDNNPS